MKTLLSTIIFCMLALFAIPALAATPLDAVVSLDGFPSSSTAQNRFLNASPDIGFHHGAAVGVSL